MTDNDNELIEHISQNHSDGQELDQDMDHLEMEHFYQDLKMEDITDPLDAEPKAKAITDKSIPENHTSSEKYYNPKLIMMVSQTEIVPDKESISAKITKKVKTPSCTIRGSLDGKKRFRCKLCKFVSKDKDLIKTHLQEKHIKKSKPNSADLQIQLLKNVPEPMVQMQSKVHSQPKSKSKQTVGKEYNYEMSPINTYNCPTTDNKQKVIDYDLENNNNSDNAKDLAIKFILPINPAFQDKQKKEIDSSLEAKNDSRVECKVSNINGIACWFCKTIFGSVIELNNHINQVHFPNNGLQPLGVKDEPNSNMLDSTAYCFLCSKQFKNPKGLTDHNFLKHAPKNLPCDQCDLKFSRQSHLNKHVRERHTLVNLKCRFCEKVFAFIRTLKSHLHVVHDYKMQENEEHSLASDNVLQSSKNQKENEESTKSQQEPSENDFGMTGQILNASDSSVTLFGVSCSQCSRVFRNKKKLHEHKIIAHEEKTIMCQNCGKTFARQYHLRRHIRFTHDVQKNVPCPHCNLVLFNEISLYKHKRIMHREKRFPCQYCSNYFATKEELKGHHTNIHPEITIFKCKNCPEEFSTQIYLFRHESSEHQMKPFECTQCASKFSTNWTLQKHTIVVHCGQEYTKDKYASCKECNKMLSNQWHLRRHMINNHLDPNTLNCRTCYNTFQTIEDYNNHVTLIHPIIKYQCKVCKKDFNTKYHINRHTRFTHPNPDQVTCDICPKTFDSKGQLKDHLSSIHPVFKYECAQCLKEFLYKWGLKRHELISHSKIPYNIKSPKSSSRLKYNSDAQEVTFSAYGHKSDESLLEYEAGSDTKHSASIIQRVPCDQCELSFATKWHQKRHIDRIHSSLEIFDCKKCSQCFTTKRLLRSHTVKEHLKGRIECKQCDKKFNRDKNLELHTSTNHTGIENITKLKIQCGSCPRSFKNNAKLETHQKSGHKARVKTCKICPAKFLSTGELKVHRLELHKNKKLDKIAIKMEQSMKIQIEQVQDTKFEPSFNKAEQNSDLFCTVCSIDFQTQRTLDFHIKVEHSITLTICKICKKGFEEVVDYMKHIKEGHSQKEVSKQNLKSIL